MKDNWTNRLPGHSPKNETWSSIENELNFDEWMANQTNDLPNHSPTELTWNCIEKQLDEPVKGISFKTINRRNYWLAAASVLIVFFAAWWMLPPTENVQISYSTEVVKEVNTDIKSADMRVIDERCEELVQVCKRPEIKDLRNEIEALSEESKTIQQQVEVFGEDPALIKAQQKVETKKAEMVQQLLAMMDYETNS